MDKIKFRVNTIVTYIYSNNDLNLVRLAKQLLYRVFNSKEAPILTLMCKQQYNY